MPRHEVYRVAPVRDSRWRRLVDSVRSYTLGPWSLKDPALIKYFGSGSASSGISVNEDTALNYSAVFSAVSLIADDIAALPLMFYKRLGNGGKTRFDAHPLYRLLHDMPNPQMTSMVFRRTLHAHTLTWGNGYAEIVRDQANRPIELWPITPDRVTPYRERTRTGFGPLQYKVSNTTGAATIFDPADILHVPGLGYDGDQGYSVIAKARESMGLGIAAERFGGTFFGNGATFGGVISYPNDPDQRVKDGNRDSLNSRHQGVDRAHKLLALYGGAKYEQIGIPPNDAQFLETRTFQVREVARWFKLPPHKLGDLADATFSNVEQQNIDYYTSCLRPWLEVWEQELDRKLIAPLERTMQFFEHVTEGFLRGDAQGRGEYYSKLFSVGGITINEIRSRENLEPIAGGDTSFVPLNMMPLDKVGEYTDAQIAKLTAPPPAPAAPKTEPDPNATQKNEAFIADLEQRMEERALALKAVAEQRAIAEAQRADALRQVAELTAECDAIVKQIKAKEAALSALTAEKEQAVAIVAAERDAAKEQAGQAEAVVAELREQAKTHGPIAERCVRLEVEQAHTVTELEAARAVKATIEAELKSAEAVKARLFAPQRDVLINAWQCIIQRETDRARKAQGSPEKLAKWVDTFYPMHDEFCRTALKPGIRAWLAFTGDERPLDVVLDGLITQHIETSRKQLLIVLDERDPDLLAPALERVLRRWETERAVAATDGFIGRS